MQLLQTSLYWLVYGVTIGLVALFATIFTYTYQSGRDRSALVSTITIITLISLLATILLLPLDIVLISSTNSIKLGAKKEWATPEKVQQVIYMLKILYITLYSTDAIFCFLIIPFTYFIYEEYEDVEPEQNKQTLGQRIFGALKYTFMFAILLLLFFFTGFFIPGSKELKDHNFDFDFYKRFVTKDHGERAFLFSSGLLISLGTLLYALFTATGMASLPVSLIKSLPSINAPRLRANTTKSLEQNRKNQRRLRYQSINTTRSIDTEDMREYQRLLDQELTLVRRNKLAKELQSHQNKTIVRLLTKLKSLFKPMKIISGIILLCFSILIWVSIVSSGVHKAKNSICKHHCGYILDEISTFQPLDYILIQSSKIFLLDYLIMIVLVLFLTCSSVAGIIRISIRFMWVKILETRPRQTLPQAMLIITVMLALIILALNYTITMMIAPQYATFGSQTFCDSPTLFLDNLPYCSVHPELIKPCSELLSVYEHKNVCTPSVISTILGPVIVNFTFYGTFLFWAQFAFLGVFLVAFLISLFRSRKLDIRKIDELAEYGEEERLLADRG